MRWLESWKADPAARVLADRHYSRRKVGARQFVPPGRALVLRAVTGPAFWITSAPLAQYVRHAWAGAWVNSAFRNEGAGLSSELIREACAASRAVLGEPPPLGLVTFIDRTKTRRKRDPGRCFRRAGFRPAACRSCGELGRELLEALVQARLVAGKSRGCPACEWTGEGLTVGGLVVLQLRPEDFPDAMQPLRAQVELDDLWTGGET